MVRLGICILGLIWTAGCQDNAQVDRPDAPDTGSPLIDTAEPPCPVGMTAVADFCIDTYEAAIADHSAYETPTTGVAISAVGIVPQGYISGVLAAAACEAAGKRLCSSEEWLRACGGPEATTWPYGNVYRSDACNDHRDAHPISSYWGNDPDRWSQQAMNDPGINQQPDTVGLTGAQPQCVSAEGVYDMHGNLHEWVADAAGVFRGGFYADAALNGPGCSYRTTAHAFGYHDYSTGFRCCFSP